MITSTMYSSPTYFQSYPLRDKGGADYIIMLCKRYFSSSSVDLIYNEQCRTCANVIADKLHV